MDICPRCQGLIIVETLSDSGLSLFQVVVWKCIMCSRRWEPRKPVYGSVIGTLKVSRQQLKWRKAGQAEDWEE